MLRQISILLTPLTSRLDNDPTLEVKIVSISEDGDDNHPSITVDGGTWTTSDKLVKEVAYDTTLTFASSKAFADLTGLAHMTDGTT